MVKLERILTSGIIGGLDIATDYIDENMNWEFPYNSKTLLRAGGFIFGLLDNYYLHLMPSDISETVALSTLPLLERTIYEWAKSAATPTTPSRVVTRYRREVPPPKVRRLEIIGER